MNYSNNFECLCLSSSTLNLFQENLLKQPYIFRKQTIQFENLPCILFCHVTCHVLKEPVKLIQQVKIAHSLQSVKLVSFYHFKLTRVVLHMAVKE